MEKSLLSIDELSEYIKIPKGTIYNWTSMKKIRYVKIGRHIRFRSEDIEEFIEKNTVMPHKDYCK